MIVVDSIHDAFLDRLSDAVMSLRVGTADDPATQVGPVIDGRAKHRILEYLEIGRREGGCWWTARRKDLDIRSARS